MGAQGVRAGDGPHRRIPSLPGGMWNVYSLLDDGFWGAGSSAGHAERVGGERPNDQPMSRPGG